MIFLVCLVFVMCVFFICCIYGVDGSLVSYGLLGDYEIMMKFDCIDLGMVRCFY